MGSKKGGWDGGGNTCTLFGGGFGFGGKSGASTLFGGCLGRGCCFFLPSTFFAVLKEGTVAVHFARPAALDSATVAPVDVGDNVRVARIPFLRVGF